MPARSEYNASPVSNVDAQSCRSIAIEEPLDERTQARLRRHRNVSSQFLFARVPPEQLAAWVIGIPTIYSRKLRKKMPVPLAFNVIR